jgi:hypothetical protein
VRAHAKEEKEEEKGVIEINGLEVTKQHEKGIYVYIHTSCTHMPIEIKIYIYIYIFIYMYMYIRVYVYDYIQRRVKSCL